MSLDVSVATDKLCLEGELMGISGSVESLQACRMRGVVQM
jgi:hypothetical protein